MGVALNSATIGVFESRQYLKLKPAFKNLEKTSTQLAKPKNTGYNAKLPGAAVTLQTHLNVQNAGIAQLVERNLAKVEVASSRLVSRSNSSSIDVHQSL